MYNWKDLALFVLGAIVIKDELSLRNNRKLWNEAYQQFNAAAKIMTDDTETIQYLLSIINRAEIDLSEFDQIALVNLGIEFKDRPQ